MRVMVLTNETLRGELAALPFHDSLEITWFTEQALPKIDIDQHAIIDLLFEHDQMRIKWLQSFPKSLIVINDVLTPLNELDGNFIRINGWNSFLKRPMVEAAGLDIDLMRKADQLFELMGRKIEWVPDMPGFVTARVISSLINEAFFSLEERVSTEEDIDLALKLGTNYPFGPFEWGKKIGLQNIHALLLRLAKDEERYCPSTLLQQKALA